MVLPKYTAVKKITGDSEFFLTDSYIDKYQMCEVVDCAEESNLLPGEKILVNAQCYFEKSDHFDGDVYCMYTDDIFGVIRDGIIVPMSNMVYIQADKNKKSKMEIGGVEMYVDTTYNPLATENVTQDGTVLSVCLDARDSYFRFPLDIEIEPGDHVYCHHFLTHEDSEREFNGKKYYETMYENMYCKIVNKEIVMLNTWNFISSIDAHSEMVGDIVLDVKKKKQHRTGVVEHLSKSLYSMGLEKGDKVIFKKGREYRIIVEGNEYYRILTNDIICKIMEENKMMPIGKIIIAKVVEAETGFGGIITKTAKDEFPDRGEVIAVGDGCPEGKLKPGDQIIFRKGTSTVIHYEGEDLLIMNYDNVWIRL
jgi:chaperonin GroES